jgi:hypothetical protein
MEREKNPPEKKWKIKNLTRIFIFRLFNTDINERVLLLQTVWSDSMKNNCSMLPRHTTVDVAIWLMAKNEEKLCSAMSGKSFVYETETK